MTIDNELPIVEVLFTDEELALISDAANQNHETIEGFVRRATRIRAVSEHPRKLACLTNTHNHRLDPAAWQPQPQP